METTGVLATNAGLFGLWSPAAFPDVVDFDTWDARLSEDEDIERHIRAGAFVPIGVGGDGVFGFAARVGPAALTERERRHLLMTSEPYLFVATDGAVLSGIEHVDAAPATGLRVPVPAGRWEVTVSLLEWDAEPGQRNADGSAKDTALPDFLILIAPERTPGAVYRTRVETFDRP